MFLSRLILNPRNAQVRQELAHPYEMHRTLLRAFKQGVVKVERSEEKAAGILFRVDENPYEQRITVLVQSKPIATPDWNFLLGQKDTRGYEYLLPESSIGDGKPNPDITQFDLEKKIRDGQILAFRLRANPTKRLGKSAGKDKGKRIGIYKEDEQLKWLEEKFHGRGRPSGFRLVRKQISHDEKVEDKPTHENTRPALEFLSVQFDGILKVENVTLACKTIEHGIGSAKGFGFGLLSVAPVKD